MSPVAASPRSREPLRVSQAARALGVGVQTLHYYERRGLVPPPPRSAKGYRLYPPEILERVRFVRKAQSLGFSRGAVPLSDRHRRRPSR